MGFFIGLADPIRGFAFLWKRPRLWPWAAIPFFLTGLLYIAVFWGAGQGLEALLDRWLPQEGTMWVALEWVMRVIAWLLTLWLAALLFIPVAMIVAEPFNDLLSERVEQIVLGAAHDEGFSIALLLRSLRVGLMATIIRSVILAGLLLFAMCFHLIPGIGSMIALVLTVIFTARMLSLEYTGYCMDRRIWDWNRQREFLRANRGRTFGFGLTASLLLVIPLVNVFFIPASAVAGTLLFLECQEEEASPQPLSE